MTESEDVGAHVCPMEQLLGDDGGRNAAHVPAGKSGGMLRRNRRDGAKGGEGAKGGSKGREQRKGGSKEREGGGQRTKRKREEHASAC